MLRQLVGHATRRLLLFKPEKSAEFAENEWMFVANRCVLRMSVQAGKKPATNKRILALLDKPPPRGYGRWTGPLLAKALADVGVQYVWRFLREHNIDLAGRKSWCESNDPKFAAKAADVP